MANDSLTPEQEGAVLNQTAKKIEADAYAAYEQVLARIREGQDPRSATEQVLQQFNGQYAETVATAMTAIMGEAIGGTATMQMEVGGILLSQKLYANAQATASVVAGIVDRHAKGFHDAQKLMLELFEGYGFREAETITLAPGATGLPQYLTNELLTDPGLTGQLERLFARAQAERLKTEALKAAYLDYLQAIEDGAGQEVLAKKLEVALYEKLRYFANRIAQTELHRAYMTREAQMMMLDADVEYLQLRMNPTHPAPDICDYFAGVDKYGMGKGVYPKLVAPAPPFHPHCRCKLVPRLDLTGKKPKNPKNADLEFFGKYGEQEAAQIAGGKSRLKMVEAGTDPTSIYNMSKDPMYRVKTVGSL